MRRISRTSRSSRTKTLPAKRSLRKQHVVLRQRHREEIKQLVHRAVRRTAVFMLVAGFTMGLVTRREWVLTHISFRPAPPVDVQAVGTLGGLPVLQEMPTQTTWLWIPGVCGRVSRKLQKRYPEIGNVVFEKQFRANRIVLRLEPRVAVARWPGQAIDSNGVIFSLPEGAHAALPEINIPVGEIHAAERQWIGRVSRSSLFWTRVRSVRRSPEGEMVLVLDTGAQVMWGHPDPASAAKKAQYVARVLEDAHDRLGGAAVADLRFFEQGRIVVRPKGV